MKKTGSLLLIFILSGCTVKDYRQLINITTANDPKQAVKLIAKQKSTAYIQNPNALITDIKKIEDIAKSFNKLKQAVAGKWGEQDTKEPSAKEYVKYINNYKSRAIVDYERGMVSIGTIDSTDTTKSLKEAIVMTILMPYDPSSEDLFNSNSIKLGGEPYLYNEIVDNEGKPIRWEGRANNFADYLIKNNIKSYKLKNGKTSYYVQIPMVKKHLDVRASKYQHIVKKYSKQYQIDEKLIYAIIKTESDFNQYAISKSGAIGLMQIMPKTAGTDAYKEIYKKQGYPSKDYLLNANNNIQMGVVYINILKSRYLKDIHHNVTQEYCVISAYNGGAGSVLKTFNTEKNKAFNSINNKTPNQVYNILTTKAPSQEMRDYLIKVQKNKKLF
ncbi:murein transglycosylase domain-containing protein [Orbaceae bacterium ac157xtp]